MPGSERPTGRQDSPGPVPQVQHPGSGHPSQHAGFPRAVSVFVEGGAQLAVQRPRGGLDEFGVTPNEVEHLRGHAAPE